MAKEKSGIAEALENITKRYGKGSIMRMGDKPNFAWEIFSTNCIPLDEALGIGGVPRGRIIEIMGEEATGKSTIALQIVANAQKAGKLVAYLDIEHSINPDYIKNLGVDIENLIISQPNSGEECLEIAEELIRSGEVAVIVIDSVAALIPQAEINGNFGDATIGLQARLMGAACRKLTPLVHESNTCLIFINQYRSIIGVTFGPTKITSGGRALKFYASMRIELSRIAQIKDGDKVIGNKTKARILKNKCSTPYKECTFDLLFGKGTSNEGSIIEKALELGILVQKGSWIAYDGSNICQGKEKLREMLSNDSSLYDSLVSKLSAEKSEEQHA